MERRRFLWLSKVVGTLVVAAFVLYRLDLPNLGALVQTLRVPPLLLCLATTIAMYLVLGCRWHLLFRAAAELSWRDDLIYFFRANLLNSFTPAMIGGDVYRAASLKSYTSSYSPVITVLLRERILGLMGYLIFYLLCMLWMLIAGSGNQEISSLMLRAALPIALALVALFCAPFLLGWLGRWGMVSRRPKLAKMHGVLHEAFRVGWSPATVRLLALSVGGVGLWLLAVEAVAWQLGVGLHWAVLGGIVVLVELIRLVPVTIQGIGVREGVFAYLVTLAGSTPEAGFIVGVASYLAVTVAMLLTGIVGFLLNPSQSPAGRPVPSGTAEGE